MIPQARDIIGEQVITVLSGWLDTDLSCNNNEFGSQSRGNLVPSVTSQRVVYFETFKSHFSAYFIALVLLYSASQTAYNVVKINK